MASPSEGPSSNPVARLFRRAFSQPSERYFQLPDTCSQAPDPDGEGPFGRAARAWGDRLYDWTGGTHPTPRLYIAVAAILAFITLVEVWVFFWPVERVVINSSLFALSAVKFVLVISFFMHLKFDAWLFRAVFISGLLLGVAIALSILALFFKLNG